MDRTRKIFWFLQIKETKNLKFCQRYLNTNELNLENNKRIIDKLADENIEKICWIGDEAINYPHFVKLLKYAKEKGIECELLFFNNYNIMKLKKFINEIDSIILTMHFLDDNFKNEFENIMNFRKKISDKTKLNILTMINSKNVEDSDNIYSKIRSIGIDTWIILRYMPILLDLQKDENLLYIPKIRARDFRSSIPLFYNGIEHFYRLSEYTISRKYNIILPNGDVAVMNEKDSILIGNILENTKERLEKNFNNKRKFIIPKKNEQKITILIASNNEKTNKKIISELEPLKYVEIIGISKSGQEAYEEILSKKPEMIFLQYNFNDIPGFELIKKIAQELKFESPVVNILGKDLPKDEFIVLYEEPYSMINSLIGKERYYGGRFSSILEQYKEYRDKD